VIDSVKIKFSAQENDRMSAIRHGISILAIMSIVLASACSNAPIKQRLDIESIGVASEAAIPAPANAEQIAERMLKLLEHLRTPEDLSPAQIQRYMGISMQPSPSDPSQFEATGRIGDGWRYSLETVQSSYRVAPYALRLRFDDGRDNGSDMSLICRFDYEQYKSSLERIGFEPRVIMGSARQVNFNHESGSGLQVVVYVRRENAVDHEKRCVDIVLIDFMQDSLRTPHSP
jgi:hypothetical protein